MKRFWWLPIVVISFVMVSCFTLVFVLLLDQQHKLQDEAQDRCVVISAIIDYAAPSKPPQLSVPAGADDALRQAIEQSNERSRQNNAALQDLRDKYLPNPC